MPKTPAGLWAKGTFVEWTSHDEKGEFKHQGLIVDYSTAYIYIQISPHGSRMTVPQGDGTLREIPKPEDWDMAAVQKEPELPEREPKVRQPRERLPGGESKADKALEIYKLMMVNGQHPARAEVIKRFMAELNMTSAGASTYQYNCKKALS